MSYEIRDITKQDCAKFQSTLREADRQEVLAASGLEPEEALLDAVGDDFAKVITIGGKLTLAFGVAPVSDMLGAVWMLSSTALDDRRTAWIVARHSRYWVDHMNDMYPVLFNYTDCRNDLHHRFLRYHGFNFINKHNIGKNGEPFYEIVRIRNV